MGVLIIITSSLMILTSIGDSSLFGIVYFLLGIFMLIHAILYLIKFKNKINETNYIDGTSNEEIKYVSLIPLILTIIFVIMGIISGKGVLGLSWPSIAIFFINVVSIILCVTLHVKKIKSSLVYVILTISIMITTFSGIFLIDALNNKKSEYNKNDYYDSEEFLINYATELEDDFLDEIMNIGNLKKMDIDITQENVIDLSEFLNVISQNEYLPNKLIYLDTLKEKGYSCKGYATLKFKELKYTDEYQKWLENGYDFDNMKYYFDSKAYIKCIGKYTYTTSGLNEDLLN